MEKHIAEHYQTISQRLAAAKSKTDLAELARYHRTRVQEFQHERLIHLLVTFFFAGLFLASLAAFLATAAMGLAMNCLMGLLMLILFVLELAYIRHYYQLENGVQRLYELTVMIDDKHQEEDIVQGEFVIIESPFKGNTPAEEAENTAYAKEAMRDSLYRGEAPFASHLLYPQMLDDADEDERRMGIEAGLLIGRSADRTVVYTDRGISPGMKQGIKCAEDEGRSVEYRSLYGSDHRQNDKN